MEIIKHTTVESQVFDFAVLTVNASYNLNYLSVPNALILINLLVTGELHVSGIHE